MDTSPLVKEQVDAGARFLRDFQKYLPVQLAAWVKEADSSGWFLYVASEQITDDNFDVAYGEVVRIAAASRDPHFDPFWVKLVGMDDPLARAIDRRPQSLPGWVPHLAGMSPGGVTVEQVYVYPTPLPIPA